MALDPLIIRLLKHELDLKLHYIDIKQRETVQLKKEIEHMMKTHTEVIWENQNLIGKLFTQIDEHNKEVEHIKGLLNGD